MNVLACPSIKKKMHCIKMINERRIRNKFIIKKKLLVYIYNMNNQMIKKKPTDDRDFGAGNLLLH